MSHLPVTPENLRTVQSVSAVLAKILSVLTRDWQTVNPEGDQ